MTALQKNLEKLHTTRLGAERIKRNLCLKTGDVVLWCRKAIQNADIVIGQGKNRYAYKDGVSIVIHAKSFTIITAHKIKGKVRAMTESDHVCLPEFLYQAIFIPKGVKPPPREIINEPEIFIYIKDFGNDAGDIGVIAEQDGQIVGAAWTRIISPSRQIACNSQAAASVARGSRAKEARAFGHIDYDTPELAISVFPEFRGNGIGGKMMKKLFHLLRQNGYKQTSLSVQKDNPAVRFYERLGYQKTGERLDHAGHEDYLMIKKL